MVSVSQRAADKILQMAQREGRMDPVLRVKVVGGGCSGLSYQFAFEDQVSPADKIFEQSGVKLAVDPRTLLYVAGSRLDYEQGLMKSGFKIANPNAASSCSCGESFSV
ncbi:MAG: hypothetical protein A2902_07110 [Elusimicrobia bacterium RIFCSPLOWO2_01_FULL_64_13]|nr:MAG: hypothetical protein A2636_01580 [Elusimicrobia bacterium RIFCSPHIGHO2_01_FULL_64_10]OGR98115.1 MAG: hypothetical protein A2902_07110 [Elusimicrobia bacterium RIFCSPLOWO2_01_FULL_64_13]